MKKAVIFDLDGLLIDSEVISHRLYDELLHRYGKSVTVAEYARDYSGKTGVANMTNVIARYNLPITVEEGLTWEVAREKELLQDVQLKPGAAALLSWLKTEGVAVVLATSSVRERAVEVLTRLGVVQYFDDMVFGTEIERGKPWPDIFLKAAEKAHAAPADCLVLEDSEAGIQAAHAAGIDVLCVPDMKNARGKLSTNDGGHVEKPRRGQGVADCGISAAGAEGPGRWRASTPTP